MPRTARKLDQDLRDYPTYTISEAATYLAIPRRTLYHWISDEPLWTTAGAGGEMQLLSFRDVAQAYFIEFIRKHVGITGRKAREILKSARLETGARYPLLDKDIKVLFQHILLDRPAKGSKPRHVVDLSQHRQLVMAEVVDLFATRIARNRTGEMQQIFPWRFYTQGDQSRPVSLNPDILSGQLVITGTRIPVRVAWARHRAGETLPALAKDYRLPEKTISDALRHFALPKAA